MSNTEKLYTLTERPSNELKTATLREKVAAMQHEIWGSWMKEIFASGVENPDGSWTIPASQVQQWREAMCGYAELSEEEKAKSRQLADEVYSLLNSDFNPS